MQPRVFRGVDPMRDALRAASLATVYLGGCAVLWGLGLVVRGWQGWLLLLAPLVGWIATRLWASRRVGVHIHHRVLRYEGAEPERDFEVPLDELEACYFDPTLPGAPLVLVIEGDERVCAELSRRASRELAAHLRDVGVRSVRG